MYLKIEIVIKSKELYSVSFDLAIILTVLTRAKGEVELFG
jgi:hypothetical protein